MKIENCSKCGGTHFGSYECPLEEKEIKKFDNKLREMSMRDKVHIIEDEMKKLAQTPEYMKLELPTRHWFGEKSYMRELFIPKDTILTGKIHKYKQINVLLLGELVVLVGEQLLRVKAPFIVVTPPGTKRLAKAIVDSIWLTVHGSDETNVEKLEEQLVANDEAEYQQFLEHFNQMELPLCSTSIV